MKSNKLNEPKDFYDEPTFKGIFEPLMKTPPTNKALDDNDPIVQILKTLLYTSVQGEYSADIVAAKAAINKIIANQVAAGVRKDKERRIEQNQSLCGCPFCTHHSEPYEKHVKGGKDNG